jgi:uncharacterized Rmd1/YagE family protein
MIFARCLAFRIYTDALPKTMLPNVRHDHYVLFRFGEASFAVVFAFGVVVFWNVPMVRQKKFVQDITPHSKHLIKPEVTDAYRLNIGKSDEILYDCLNVAELSQTEVIALSYLFAQAAVLKRMDQTVDDQLYELNRILRPIQETGESLMQRRQLLRKLAEVLRDRTHSFYEYGFHSQPPEAWSNPRIERLYQELGVALEISQQMRIVQQKWDTVSDTLQFVLSLLSEKKSVRFELILLFFAVMADVVLTFWQVVAR